MSLGLSLVLQNIKPRGCNFGTFFQTQKYLGLIFKKSLVPCTLYTKEIYTFDYMAIMIGLHDCIKNVSHFLPSHLSYIYRL